MFCFSVSDTDVLKQTEPETEKRLAVKDKRRGRKERRSTGIVQPGGEVRNTYIHGHAHVHRQLRARAHTCVYLCITII